MDFQPVRLLADVTNESFGVNDKNAVNKVHKRVRSARNKRGPLGSFPRALCPNNLCSIGDLLDAASHKHVALRAKTSE